MQSQSMSHPNVSLELYKKFKEYFPEGEIPVHALEKVKWYDGNKYIYATPELQEVKLDKIVGTWREQYSVKYGLRWIDLLENLKKVNQSHLQPNKIYDLVYAPTTILDLVWFAESDTYYLYDDGSHRLSFYKLSNKESIWANVRKAAPKPCPISELPVDVIVTRSPEPDLFLKFCFWISNLFRSN